MPIFSPSATSGIGPAFGFFGHVAGRYYIPFGTGLANTVGAAGTAAKIRFTPFILKEAVTLSNLVVNVVTAAAGSNFQLGIYASDPVTKKPTGAALAASASSSSGAATGIVSVPISVSLKPGLYWIGIIVDSATLTFTGVTANGSAFGQVLGAASAAVLLATATEIQMYYITATLGTWPDVTAASFTEFAATTPLVAYQVASIP